MQKRFQVRGGSGSPLQTSRLAPFSALYFACIPSPLHHACPGRQLPRIPAPGSQHTDCSHLTPEMTAAPQTRETLRSATYQKMGDAPPPGRPIGREETSLPPNSQPGSRAGPELKPKVGDPARREKSLGDGGGAEGSPNLTLLCKYGCTRDNLFSVCDGGNREC